LIQAFFTHAVLLEEQVAQLLAALKAGGILWICYPIQSTKQDTDLNRDILRENLTGRDLKAVSLVSIDNIWSAMRFKQL
jgi:hypothetical protein